MFDEAVTKHNSILVFNEKRMPINKTNNYHPEKMIGRPLNSLKAIMRTTRGRIRTLKNKQNELKREIYFNKRLWEITNNNSGQFIDPDSFSMYNGISNNEAKIKIREIGLDIQEYITSLRVMEKFYKEELIKYAD